MMTDNESKDRSNPELETAAENGIAPTLNMSVEVSVVSKRNT